MKETKIAKDKPLIEEVVEWINPWGDKESAIPTRKVAEAVKKLKEDILFRKEFAQNEDEDIVLRDLLIDIDKIMGNFPNAKGESVMYEPAKKIMGNFNHSPSHQVLDDSREVVHTKKASNVGASPILDTHIKKEKGCGEEYEELNEFDEITVSTCGVDGLCPKCEDKQ